MKDSLKMDIISLLIKIMCNGSDGFILIIFHLVSNSYYVYIVLCITLHVLLVILDILKSENKDYVVA